MRFYATVAKKDAWKQKHPVSALHRILLERINNGECSILSSRIATKEDPLTLDEIIAAVNQEDLLCIEIVEEIGQKFRKTNCRINQSIQS